MNSLFLLVLGTFLLGLLAAFPHLGIRWSWRRSRDWPMTEAKFESGYIDKQEAPEGQTILTLRMTYTYSVQAAPYYGQ
jgi:hypothetical protein